MPATDTSIFPLLAPESASVAPAALHRNPGAVVDLALSRRHREGHISGRPVCGSRPASSGTSKIAGQQGPRTLTSEDCILARFGPAEITTRAGRPVTVLSDGTAVWQSAGMPRLAAEPDDVSLSARYRRAERERHMREYVAWEVRPRHDCRFRLAPAAA
jgi:hypothetical protein